MLYVHLVLKEWKGNWRYFWFFHTFTSFSGNTYQHSAYWSAIPLTCLYFCFQLFIRTVEELPALTLVAKSCHLLHCSSGQFILMLFYLVDWFTLSGLCFVFELLVFTVDCRLWPASSFYSSAAWNVFVLCTCINPFVLHYRLFYMKETLSWLGENAVLSDEHSPLETERNLSGITAAQGQTDKSRTKGRGEKEHCLVIYYKQGVICTHFLRHINHLIHQEAWIFYAFTLCCYGWPTKINTPNFCNSKALVSIDNLTWIF